MTPLPVAGPGAGPRFFGEANDVVRESERRRCALRGHAQHVHRADARASGTSVQTTNVFAHFKARLRKIRECVAAFHWWMNGKTDELRRRVLVV